MTIRNNIKTFIISREFGMYDRGKEQNRYKLSKKLIFVFGDGLDIPYQIDIAYKKH